MILKSNCFKNIIAVLFFLIVTLKTCQIAFASESLSGYYGDICNSYRNISTTNVTEYILPEGFYCFSVDVNGSYYLCIGFQPYMLDALSVYRNRIVYDFSGNILSILPSDNVQLLYGSNVSVTVDGVQYSIRNMVITGGIITECPYFKTNSIYASGNVTDPRVLAVSTAFKEYYYGVKAYRSGSQIGDINANVNIDTSQLESLVSDGNVITQDINDKIDSLNIDFDTSGIISYLHRSDIWLLVIMFAVVLTLFRTVIHQMGRNVRGRS